MSQNEHFSVMRDELISAMLAEADGIYIDATFGRGGHTRALLEKLAPTARLIAIDQDPQASVAVDAELAADPRFSLEYDSFANIVALARRLEITGKINGIMADLGVSSPQLDQAKRGFSFLRDGPLDMRMNPQAGESAAEWLATVTEADLADVLYKYGDEKFSRRIAQAIVKARTAEPLTATLQLAEIIKAAHPRWPKHHHPATKSFQAIRIYINQEMAALEALLQGSTEVLAPGGKLAILTFHSLEDRMVKKFF